MALDLIAAAALAVWAYLLLGHGGFWRARERLEPSPEPDAWPQVAILIPARNEAATIGAALHSHSASDYPGEFSVIVINDDSSDETAVIARAASDQSDRRIDVINAPPLQKGWSGKLAALEAGLAHAESGAHRPDYLLFTDADIVHAPSTLRRLVAKMECEKLALASLMARLDSRGFWGSLLIPAFVYFFQKLYPFGLSNNRDSRVAAGAGGCMLVRRTALEAAGGLKAIRERLIDDCALADRLKRHGAGAPRPIWTGLAADEVVSLRDNSSLASIWNMVARTAFTQLRYSWLLLAATIAGMALIYLAPPAIALTYPLHRQEMAGALGLAAGIAMATSYTPTLRLYGQSPWRAALLPAAALFYSAMTVSSACRHWSGSGGQWKGRTYP